MNGGNWCGLKEHQVVELVRKCRKKLGLGDTVGTIENTREYNSMQDSDRPFLHWSFYAPHAKREKGIMRAMMFANPELLGLLNGNVDIFVDATRLSTTFGQNGHNFCKNGVTTMFEVAKWIVSVVPGQP